MSDVSSIHLSQPARSTTQATPGRAASSASSQIEAQPLRSASRGTDQVEVSALATYLSKLKQLPPVRQDLIDSVKAQIAAGTYDTPEKFEAAFDQMLNDETR